MKIDKGLVALLAGLVNGTEVAFVYRGEREERDFRAHGWYLCVGEQRAAVPDDGIVDAHRVHTVELFVTTVNTVLAALDRGELRFVALYASGDLEDPDSAATKKMKRDGTYDDNRTGNIDVGKATFAFVRPAQTA